MSHLISGVELEAMPVFSHTPAQIVKPRFKQYVRATGNTMESFGSHNDKALMAHICERYTKLEQENIVKERDLFVSEQCSSLKGKIKNILHPKSRQVGNFFQDREGSLEERLRLNELNVRKIGEGMPRKVDIERKYNTHLQVRMRVIQEARLIEAMKERQMNWTVEHEREHSPNFTKMAYMLEKMDRKGILPHTPTRNQSLVALGITAKGEKRAKKRKMVDCGKHRQSSVM